MKIRDDMIYTHDSLVVHAYRGALNRLRARASVHVTLEAQMMTLRRSIAHHCQRRKSDSDFADSIHPLLAVVYHHV